MTHNYQTASAMRRFIALAIDTLLVGGVICLFFFYSMGKTPSKLQASGDEGRPSLMDKYQFFAYFEPMVMDPLRITYLDNFVKKYKMNIAIGLFLIPFLYFLVFEGFLGRSIGKFLTGIEVRRKDGGKISFSSAFIRALVKAVLTVLSTTVIFYTLVLSKAEDMVAVGVLAVVTLIIAALFFFLMNADRKRQAIQDKIANTLVLKKGTTGI
ncbi:MAG: RDD family protein [Chitinophagales bacterium]